MEIVFSREEDIPEIVELLKRSLGERLTPKTEEYFFWKHYKNAFGQSISIVAKENGIIVGVRTFMKWEWCFENKNISSVRAVDTATDPDFQGRGIFSKLTLNAIDECQKQAVSFVFNTPNPISLKGYLKLGWHSIGKLPLSVSLGSMFPRLFDLKKKKLFYKEFDIYNQIKKLEKSWSFQETRSVSTKLTIPYLCWRYVDCPVATYGALIEPGKFGFIFRLKKIKLFYELRICESWLEHKVYESEAQNKISKVLDKIRPLIITESYFANKFHFSKRIKLNFFSRFLGPETTIRSIAENKTMSELIRFNTWSPSLGAMELF